LNQLILVFQILYISDLSEHTSAAQTSDVLASARTRNAERNITGVLLFDGAHFVQLLEGDHGAVTALMQRIDADARHRNIIVLHTGVTEKRRFLNFGAGYWYVDDESQSAAILRSLSGHDALQTVLSRSAEFDVAR
jgi:Sensors of blue-light using FAD